jgi:hypothetical protein
MGMPRFVKSGGGMLGGLSLRVDDSLLITSFGGTLGASPLDNDDARDWRDYLAPSAMLLSHRTYP